MIKKTVLALGFACGLLAFSVSDVKAQCNCLPQIPSYGNRVFKPNPPYFAMHPPVYYNRIVPRAYGISPYAVPPGVMPVENSVKMAPKSVSNPFYKGERVIKSENKGKKAAMSKDNFAQKSKAKKVANPFYLQKVVTAE